MIADLEKDLRLQDEDLHKDCIDRINGAISSTDRRFDYVTNDIHKLEDTVNPNKDFLKKQLNNLVVCKKFLILTYI